MGGVVVSRRAVPGGVVQLSRPRRIEDRDEHDLPCLKCLDRIWLRLVDQLEARRAEKAEARKRDSPNGVKAPTARVCTGMGHD